MDSESRKNAVKDFLQRCLDYAHETIAKKTESGDDLLCIYACCLAKNDR
jgi:hypothetical protein